MHVCEHAECAKGPAPHHQGAGGPHGCHLCWELAQASLQRCLVARQGVCGEDVGGRPGRNVKRGQERERACLGRVWAAGMHLYRSRHPPAERPLVASRHVQDGDSIASRGPRGPERLSPVPASAHTLRAC